MSQPYAYIFDLLGQSQEIAEDSILSRTVYSDSHMKAILFTFAAGQELSEHTSAQTAILHFLRGEADVTLGEDSMAAQAGTWIHMAPRLPHSIVAKTPVVMLLLMVKGASGA